MQVPMPSGMESRRASLARAFFEDNADALFLVDPDTGQIRDGNSMAMRLSGRTRAELVGQRLGELFHSELAGGVQRLYRACHSELGVHAAEGYALRRPGDATLLPVNVSVSRIRAGSRLLALVAARDVADRKKAEQELSSRRCAEDLLREALHRTLIDSLEQGIFLKDRDLRYIAANGPYCASLALPEGGVLGKTDLDLYPRSRAEKYQAEDRLVVSEGKRLEYEETLQHEGRQRIIRIIKTPVQAGKDQITGVLGICWDVTEQHRVEDQLRQAQKMEAIGQLAGGVAHDFNNLLTAILGNLSMLAGTLASGDPNRALVAAAEQATSRASALANQLLSLGRQSVLHAQPINLNTSIDEAIGLLHRALDPRIELVAKREPGLWNVLADPGQIQQVLMNLCLNARDAMPAGGRLQLETTNVALDTEYARLHVESRPGEFVRLRVSDTGTGIPSEVRARIFEPFFTTKGPGKGTGLGLAMVFSIVKQHRGWIDCYSEPGKGTRFDVYLPRHAGSQETAATPAAPISANGGQGTILLADDEAALRNLGRLILERYGYQVLVAEDGQEAVELFRRQGDQIALAILDLSMPRLSGREACRRIRQINPTALVLLSSGYSHEQVETETCEAVGFISKPYRPADLVAAVRAALNRTVKPSPP